MKGVLKFLIVAIALIAVERFCHNKTEGFTILKIQSDLPYNPHWETAPLEGEEKQFISETLSQPFFYLGSGAQCYAFLSQDGKSVIKFFKHHHMRPDHPIHKIPLPSGLKKKRRKVIGNPEKRIEEVFTSCKLAYENLREESGLIAIHLTKSVQYDQTITLFDKLGIGHEIDPNKLEFVLQKKAEPIFTQIRKKMSSGKLEEARESVQNFVQFVLVRCQKGILDKDNALKRNIGFVGNQPIMIDIGSLFVDPKLTKEKQKKEFIRKTGGLGKWLEKYYPSLVPLFDEEVEASLCVLSG